MKKILLATVAVIGLAACSQNEEFESKDQRTEIKIGTTAVTRATVLVSNNFKDFKAYGYAFEGSYGSETEGKQILDGSFTKKANWEETSNKVFYWPASGLAAFFGYSPSTNATYTYAKGSPSLAYTVKTDIAQQEDFVVAKEITDEKPVGGSISLGFGHALTQVEFNLKGFDNNFTYTVSKIVLKGVKKQGVYNYLTSGWASVTTTDTYTMILTTTIAKGAAAPVALNANDQLLILMPQELANVTVEVTYSAVDASGVEYATNETKSASITGTWAPGDKFVYTLVLKPGSPIDVQGTLSGTWTPKDPQPGDVDVSDDVAP